jgi:putative ABC transport system ATP-binding protein
MTSDSIIHLEAVRKVYHSGDIEVEALRGINLQIKPGDFIAIMGASGSGKSTLMNLLGCLDRPTSGIYLFAGENVSTFSRDELARIRGERIGFVFQGFNLLSRTSAIDNVMLPLLYSKKFSIRQSRQKAMDLLTKFGLGERYDHHPNQLSGGQQQRVAIARSLINDPDVLLADEPTGNLDTKTGLEILAEFQRLNREENQTIIMVTHDREIANCCTRQVVISDGTVVADRRTPNLRDAAAELVQFLASGRHVLLEAAS